MARDNSVTRQELPVVVDPPTPVEAHGSGSECGVCQRPAEVIATVPMCGHRPRYAMCWECFKDINDAGYAENVKPIQRSLIERMGGYR